MKSFGRLSRDLVTSGALKNLNRNPGALLVLMVYIAHTNREGIAWIGAERIAEWCGITTETVRKARRRLEAEGLLVATGETKGRAKVYRMPQRTLGVKDDRSPNTGASYPPTSVELSPNAGAADPPTHVGANKEEQKITEVEQNPAEFPAGSNEDRAYRRLLAATAGEGGES